MFLCVINVMKLTLASSICASLLRRCHHHHCRHHPPYCCCPPQPPACNGLHPSWFNTSWGVGKGQCIFAAWLIKEIDGATLGLCHVGEALLLELHLAVAEGVELTVGFSPPCSRVHGRIGKKQFLGGTCDQALRRIT